MYKQDPPFSIQVELTEGCNRGCNFCGLRGMRKKGTEPHYFMTKETVEQIISEVQRVGWSSRFIFSMHGEPTLNKNCLRVIKMFRKAFPKAVLSIMTNGYAIANKLMDISDFEKAGLNDLIIDIYHSGDDGDRIMHSLVEGHYQVLDKGVPLYGSSSSKFRILFNPPIQGEGAAINRHLCNHCGAAAPLDFSYKDKRCARPFRELAIRYDGNIALCCNDFRGEYPIGNINDTPIDELWHSKRFKAARILLYAGDRTFTPCYGCNALSLRVGLLPDKLGKREMPEPTKEIVEYAKHVSEENEPLCGKDLVKRKWEKEE